MSRILPLWTVFDHLCFFLWIILQNERSIRAFVQIKTFTINVKNNNGISQHILVLLSKYAPIPTSKKGAKFPIEL